MSNSLVQVGSLIDTHALAAPIKDIFNVGSKASDSYTSVAVYKSKGADPELSRNLTKSITVVERQVHSARASFQKVHRIINDPGLALCRDSSEHKSLLDEWQEIEKSFETVLKKSRGVAHDGAAIIKDFLKTIIPYLLSKDGMGEKLRELREYRKTLEAGEKLAGVFADGFRETSTRVLDFQHKWGVHAKESNSYLRSEIDKLQSDINAASESIGKTRQNFSSFIAQKWLEDEPGLKLNPSTAKRSLQGFIVEAKKASKTQKKADVQVYKNTAEIKRKTDDLVVVWDFILSDLDTIEGEMKVAETSNAFQVFSERVDRLGVQYVHLKNALEMYAIAMARQDAAGAPTVSFWRKLIGQ